MTTTPLPDGLSIEGEAAPPREATEPDCPDVPIAVAELAVAVQRLRHDVPRGGKKKRTADRRGKYKGDATLALSIPRPPAPGPDP